MIIEFKKMVEFILDRLVAQVVCAIIIASFAKFSYDDFMYMVKVSSVLSVVLSMAVFLDRNIR
jgi:hypothetical protein